MVGSKRCGADYLRDQLTPVKGTHLMMEAGTSLCCEPGNNNDVIRSLESPWTLTYFGGKEKMATGKKDASLAGC